MRAGTLHGVFVIVPLLCSAVLGCTLDKSSSSEGLAGAGAAGGASAGGGMPGDSAGSGSVGAGGAAVDCDSKSDQCASEFGSLFTKSNGRADGALVALLQTTDQQCAEPNSSHAVLQLSMLGQVQRLVVSVSGVAVTTVSAPLAGPAYSEGWHEEVPLDYATDLGVHSTGFTSVSITEAERLLCEYLDVGAPVSVYAYSDGSKPSSAHQIHYNDTYPDGAIVAEPTSGSPTYLLFRYDDQVF